MYQILLFTQVLGGYKNPNTKLISLNLTGNKIADPGAKALANVSSHSHTYGTVVHLRPLFLHKTECKIQCTSKFAVGMMEKYINNFCG